jgi:hypothetical protein
LRVISSFSFFFYAFPGYFHLLPSLPFLYQLSTQVINAERYSFILLSLPSLSPLTPPLTSHPSPLTSHLSPLTFTSRLSLLHPSLSSFQKIVLFNLSTSLHIQMLKGISPFLPPIQNSIYMHQ